MQMFAIAPLPRTLSRPAADVVACD